MEEEKNESIRVEKLDFWGNDHQILVLALQSVMYPERNTKNHKEIKITAMKGKGLKFVCQDEICSSTALIKSNIFETFNVLCQAYDRGDKVEDGNEVELCVNPTSLVNFLKMIPSDRNVSFEYPYKGFQLKVTSDANMDGLKNESYTLSESLKISASSSEYVTYAYPKFSQEDVCCEIWIGARVFKKILKEFSDLGKEHLLRFQYSVENNQLQIIHRDNFYIDSDSLPTVINENDGSSFRSVAIKASSVSYGEDDQSDNRDWARYYRISALRFVFSRFSKESKDTKFSIFDNGDLKIYFIFDENPLIEFTVKCHQNDDDIDGSSDGKDSD